jgi:hypothetical protein
MKVGQNLKMLMMIYFRNGINGRPRKTLGFATPDEVFSGLVDKAANAVTSQNAEGVRYGT